MTVTRISSLMSSLASSAAGDVRPALARAGHLVGAADDRAGRLAVDPEAVLAVAEVGDVVVEDVVPAPAGPDHVHLEAVDRRDGAGVAADQPAVALHVQPRVSRVHALAAEHVALDRAAGRALLDVDRLGARVGADAAV